MFRQWVDTKRLNSFNEQASGELYAKAAADAMKAPFGF
jgi:hypothetical protein